MNILVLGSEVNLSEVCQKFGDTHNYMLFQNAEAIEYFKTDVSFDFVPNTDLSKRLHQVINSPSFLNTAFHTLSSLIDKNNVHSFGFCGIETFVNRQVLETSVINQAQKEHLKSVCNQLGTDFVCIEDQIGMVTPRVICMIINEAYITLEEGTATRKDIDLAMRLGTNYPYGPFEWSHRIGLKNVVDLLDAVYNSTNDLRYLVSPLLRKESVFII